MPATITLTQICEKTECVRATVIRLLKKNGIKPLFKEHDAGIYEWFYDKNQAYKFIAEKNNSKASMIYKRNKDDILADLKVMQKMDVAVKYGFSSHTIMNRYLPPEYVPKRDKVTEPQKGNTKNWLYREYIEPKGYSLAFQAFNSTVRV